MEAEQKNKVKEWILGILIVLALAGVGFFLYKRGFWQRFSSIKEMQAYIRGFGEWALPVFFVLQFLQVIAAPIPGNITTLVGSLLFGFWPAILTSIGAVIGGSMFAFWLARRLGKPFVSKLIGEKLTEKYLTNMTSRYRVMLGVMFIFPFFPDDALAMMAGLTAMRPLNFLLIVTCTRPWGLIVSALVGSGQVVIPVWGWVIIACCSAAFLYVSFRYSDKIEGWLTRFLVMPISRFVHTVFRRK